MAVTEQEMLEDLAYTESEGPADMMESGTDSWDSFGEDEEEAEFFGEAGDYGEDEFDGFGEDAYDASEADEALGSVLGNILGAEDEDEFFGKLLGGIKNIVKKAAPVVGKIARGAAPILSMIPHPAAQVAGKVAGVLGKLKAEGASVEDALEAVAEIAVQDRRAVPIVAGLAARSVLKDKAATMPPGQRKQAARAVTSAARTLVSQGGPKAIRAMPRIAKSVRRTAASKGTPAAVRPQVLARTASKVARRPDLLRNLSRPLPRGQSIVQRSNGSVRNIQVPSGATITITVG
jgi:hypothetical protein